MFITEHEREPSAQWVSAREAVARARKHYSNDLDAREFIIRRAGLDRILTRCKSMRIEKRAGRVDVIERTDCLVSPEFWTVFESRRRTLRDWHVGDFELTMEGRLGDRQIVLLAGVQFSETDLIAELPAEPVEWVHASEAYDMLSKASLGSWLNVAICSRAFEKLVRAKAAKFVWEEGRPKRRYEKLNYDVPNTFWWAEGGEALNANWATGDFATWIESTWQWKAFGVEFAKADIEAMMPRLNGSTPADRKSDGDTEKVSALPSDEIISAKMLELIGIGVKRDEAVKLIRQIAGFEAVGNEHARRVINGQIPRGRPKNA